MDFLQKNEVLLRGQNEWLWFDRPHKLIVCERLEDVPHALEEIERLVEARGWHAAGFVSYEAAPAFEPALPSRPLLDFPYLWFGLYPPPRPVQLPAPSPAKLSLDWQPTVSRETYHAAIGQIREFIAEGRTYQVNYTMRLQTDFDSSPWEFFLHLAQHQNQYAAYIDTGRFVVCSASPELFFALDGETITSRPMKGTARRGRTTREDKSQAEWLMDSEKNRAENVMIVDMIRNDLGRIASPGSVRVPELFHLERYPTLWQMTSSVSARTNASFRQIFSALFPCASITGAPKVSTMKLIHALETAPRRIYTGTIGCLSPGRQARFNVAIRTALVDRQEKKAEYGAGGGVVWDSTSADEYAEALLKARLLTGSPPPFSLLETMLWTPENGIYLMQKHIERLLDSADYFDFPVSEASLHESLDHLILPSDGPYRVRLLLDQDGNINLTTQPVAGSARPILACLADQPVDSGDVFLFHKTTRREVYDRARESHPACDDVLLYNEHGELTEFTIGNLVVELDGRLFTPPIECGLLPGTFRAHLLETGGVTEHRLPLHRLKECTKIYRVNSVRRWEPVKIL